MFEIDNKHLREAVGLTSKYTTSRTIIPALGAIKLESREDGTLILSATNLASAGTIQLSDVAVDEPGITHVPARTLSDILSAWDSRVTAKLNPKTQTLTLSGVGEKQVKLKCITPDEAPLIRSIIAGTFQPTLKITMSGTVFAPAAKRVAVAASNEDARPILTGIHLRVDHGYLVLEAANGFIAAQERITANGWKPEFPGDFNPPGFRALIPANLVVEAAKVAGDDDVEIGFELSGKEVTYTTFAIPSKGIELASSAIQGSYPALDQVIPQGETKNQYTVDSYELARALKLADVVSETTITRIDIDYTTSSMIITANGDEVGDMKDTLPVSDANQTEGTFTTAFNCKLLSAIIDGRKMTFSQDGTTLPARLTYADLPGYVSVIMPMHLAE